MLLSDSETKVDFLNNEVIAKTITGLITAHSENPITIGIHGDWGAGKSSVLEMLELQLKDSDGVACIKFNGWRYQGFEDAKIALMEGIITELINEKGFTGRVLDLAKNLLKRIDYFKIAKTLGLAAGAVLLHQSGDPSAAGITSLAVASAITGAAELKEAVATKEGLEDVVEKGSEFIKPADEKKRIPTEINEFRKCFTELLEKANIKKLVVLVDDLDRCLPETVIETLEAIRLFVFMPNTAFVIAADEGMIEYAVKKHFPDLADFKNSQIYSRNYLEKLIQVPFRIPALGEVETSVYTKLLLISEGLGENDPDFNKVLEVAREILKRPWQGRGLDSTAVNNVLKEKISKVQEFMFLSDQISPILAKGTKGNPRNIKRFINALLLRQYTADARGFGSDVTTPILAKLMLLERFNEKKFNEIAGIAASASDGKCTELSELESSVRSAPVTISGKGAPAEPLKGAKDSFTSDWLSDSEMCSWAKIEPQLGDKDLRPYLFIAKDKNNYFLGSSTSDSLSNLIAQLLGGKLAVAGTRSEVKSLIETDADRVFEVLREKLVGSNLASTPTGADGIALLLEEKPNLQIRLLDLLESLPTEKLGLWAVRAWAGIKFDTGNITRYATLLEKWSAITDNKTLSKIAKSELTTLKRV